MFFAARFSSDTALLIARSAAKFNFHERKGKAEQFKFDPKD
jgi:hypothetical protein